MPAFASTDRTILATSGATAAGTLLVRTVNRTHHTETGGKRRELLVRLMGTDTRRIRGNANLCPFLAERRQMLATLRPLAAVLCHLPSGQAPRVGRMNDGVSYCGSTYRFDDSSRTLSAARSFRLAERIARARKGASHLENPAGVPRFRIVMRVASSDIVSHV